MVTIQAEKNSFSKIAALAACIVLMSAYVVYEQAISAIGTGMDIQLERHARFMAGDAEFYNPWQYRIFAEYVVEGVALVFQQVPALSHPYLPYFFVKFVQVTLILSFLLLFCRKLNIQNFYVYSIGILLAAYQMSNSMWQADMALNTYFDLLFYLIAGWLILSKRYLWIVPLSILAAFNRETAGFIPLLLLIPALQIRPGFRIRNKRLLYLCGLSLLGFGLVFMGLRWYWGPGDYRAIHDLDTPLEILSFNLRFFNMYPQLLGTLGIVPLIILFGYKRWPAFLKATFWLMVPAWFIIHFLKSMAMETRLFLVPQLFIFLPILLYLLEHTLAASFKKKIPEGAPYSDEKAVLPR